MGFLGLEPHFQDPFQKARGMSLHFTPNTHLVVLRPFACLCVRMAHSLKGYGSLMGSFRNSVPSSCFCARFLPFHSLSPTLPLSLKPQVFRFLKFKFVLTGDRAESLVDYLKGVWSRLISVLVRDCVNIFANGSAALVTVHNPCFFMA